MEEAEVEEVIKAEAAILEDVTIWEHGNHPLLPLAYNKLRMVEIHKDNLDQADHKVEEAIIHNTINNNSSSSIKAVSHLIINNTTTIHQEALVDHLNNNNNTIPACTILPQQPRPITIPMPNLIIQVPIVVVEAAVLEVPNNNNNGSLLRDIHKGVCIILLPMLLDNMEEDRVVPVVWVGPVRRHRSCNLPSNVSENHWSLRYVVVVVRFRMVLDWLVGGLCL